MTNDLEAKRAELLAKQRKELEKMEAEHSIAVLAPIPPHSVMLVSSGEKAWLTYRAPSLWEALDILAKFQPLALGKFKGTYTRVEPEALNATRKEKDRGEEVAGPLLCDIDVSQGEGFGPTVSLRFFAMLGEHICKVNVGLERERFGGNSFGQYGAGFVRRDRGQARRLDDNGSRYVSGDFVPNSKLSGMTDSYIKWGSGTRESCHFTYAMGADYMDDDTGVAGYDLDAIHRLENIALAMHGERSAVIVKEEHTERVGGAGKLLEMSDGSIWFHPYSGAKPVCEKPARK